MELINKKHPEIVEGKIGKHACYMSIHHDRIYFTQIAAIRFGLQPGKYLHFINDGRCWQVLQNDDPDGFELMPDRKKNCKAVFLCNRPLIRKFMRSTGFKDGTRLYLLKTDAHHNGASIIEIVTNKTFDEFIKQS